MNVLVAGGDGFVGSHLCPVLVERGHEVTVLSRSPDASKLPDEVRLVEGDVTKYASIADEVAGHDAVVNLVALSPLFKPSGGDRMHFTVHLGGTENLLEAAEKGDVDRFVQMSALGADPNGPTHYIRAKGEAEETVKRSDLDWVVFQPSVIFGDGGEFIPFTKKLAPPYVTPLPGGGSTRFQPIWVEDFVPMLADGVEEERHVGHAYVLAGPDEFTLADVARLAHAADGRPVNVVPVPMVLSKVGLTIAGYVPWSPMGPDQYRSLQFDNTTDDNDVDAFGVDVSDLKRLHEYLGLA